MWLCIRYSGSSGLAHLEYALSTVRLCEDLPMQTSGSWAPLETI
jgi:hypothetical protein